MSKYIISKIERRSDGIWFRAEIQKRFLFWKYWENLTKLLYSSITSAEDAINLDATGDLIKQEVIKEFEF